jgi:hypothetical protein
MSHSSEDSRRGSAHTFLLAPVFLGIPLSVEAVFQSLAHSHMAFLSFQDPVSGCNSTLNPG